MQTTTRSTRREDVQVFRDETYEKIFGVDEQSDRQWADELVQGIQRLDRALLPPPAAHPLQALIVEGRKSVDVLVGYVEAGLAGRATSLADEQRALDAVDALAHVFVHLRGGAPKAAVERLRAVMAEEKDPDRVAYLAKTLAIGRDEQLLFSQLRALADPDPAIVATAARLIGFGRYRPAVPVLRALVSPQRFFESRWVIWALGEIGDAAALPELSLSLSQGFRVVDCLIAMGKIKDVVAVGWVLPWAARGLPEQRDAAWRALAMILDGQRADDRGVASARVAEMARGIAPWIEAELAEKQPELSPSTRYFMLLCLARLGQKMPPSKIKKVLGIQEASAAKRAAMRLKKKGG